MQDAGLVLLGIFGLILGKVLYLAYEKSLDWDHVIIPLYVIELLLGCNKL